MTTEELCEFALDRRPAVIPDSRLGYHEPG